MTKTDRRAADWGISRLSKFSPPNDAIPNFDPPIQPNGKGIRTGLVLSEELERDRHLVLRGDPRPASDLGLEREEISARPLHRKLRALPSHLADRRLDAQRTGAAPLRKTLQPEFPATLSGTVKKCQLPSSAFQSPELERDG